MARAGLLAPAAQAESSQLTPHGGAEVGLVGVVEPFAVAVGGGLASGGGVAALDLESVAPQARLAPPLVCGTDAAADVDEDVVRVGGGRSVAAVDETVVRFAPLNQAEIEAYVASGEPLQCAGGFALEGRGGLCIDGLEGCYSNVIGLSLPWLRTVLGQQLA